jgi:hypothetical protein
MAVELRPMNHSYLPAPQTTGYSDDVTEGENRDKWGIVQASTNHEFVYD